MAVRACRRFFVQLSLCLCFLPCYANSIQDENARTGTPASQWDVNGAGDPSIQGFATDISVNTGGTVAFKIKTVAASYTIDIYRMGYYQALGARKVASVQPSAALPQTQPACLNDSTTGLNDCGNWTLSASWSVPADAVSGIYFARLTRIDVPGDKASHIVFVVRNDSSQSDLLFQTSDTTWQAYNQYGGNSLYVGLPAGRAYKVSYNRPITTRGTSPEDYVFNAEYPMVRWLEANGYDVTYSTGVDADRNGSLIPHHKVYMSVGHDEYWSAGQRANVEAARAAHVHLAFFSGNEIFWKTRWEPSTDGSGTAYRTLVCYKETHADAKIDPQDPPTWTGTWRDPRFSPPADGGRPENALSGTIFDVNCCTYAIQVPQADGRMRFWRNTAVGLQSSGSTATLPDGTLGYEWDSDLDNGARPAGLFHLSTTVEDVPQLLLDFGTNYGPGTATHSVTLYKHSSGALIFGAGTVQWSWGLDGDHDRGSSLPDGSMQQATVNLFADMGVQPATLQSPLTPATSSTDQAAPTSTITFPIAGASVQATVPVTITGTSVDLGGGVVAGVEVSTDSSVTWHPAVGREAWSYAWLPSATGSTSLQVRAVDDSGNLEGNGGEGLYTVSVTVQPAPPPTCPCSIFNGSGTPFQDSANDQQPSGGIETGVRFRSDVDGFITGIQFYKGAANTGVHEGHLWDDSGALLGLTTFPSESASGWQEALFSSPVPITANTTYVASYFSPNGYYAYTQNYFAQDVASPPLHGLASGAEANGIYDYASAPRFPASSFQASNYWVDVIFNTSGVPDPTPPTVTGMAPVSGTTGVSVNTAVSATFSKAMNPSTITASTFMLTSGSTTVPATLVYSAASQKATLTPAAPLTYSTTYTATVAGGSSGVQDTNGNALASTVSWTFTTAAVPPPPPNDGPGGPILVISSASNPFSRYYTEILRNEGLNEFLAMDISLVAASTLTQYDTAILGEFPLTADQVSMLSAWVSGGGNLIAMRPDKQLASVLGLTDTGSSLSNAYLLVNTSSSPGAGLVNQTIQFHGSADLYTATTGATVLATLYSSATTSTTSPAVTLAGFGSGQAAAFTYDLARSVVYTREGNPAWSGMERDGISPIRSDDLFYGAASSDPQPDWVDLNKVAIPQADEQQRLLANLILQLNLTRKPLPRFWYFPGSYKAVVIMTGDDHGNGGTVGRFNTYLADSPQGCSLPDWQCVRGTSYMYSESITNDQAITFAQQGFELALHVTTDCVDWTPASLESFFATQLSTFASTYPGILAPSTNRTHCIVWSDYDTHPQVELNHGIRLDTNYYYWPDSWLQDRPGMFTGSGMPMRFAKRDGTILDIYQATTQMTDESGQTYPKNIDTLLGNAAGPLGYYGVFTANMHNDSPSSAGADAIVASAQAHGVPIVTSLQMLNWLDGRNGSSFGSMSWIGNTLTFTVSVAAGARSLQAMLPTNAATGSLAGISLNGTAVSLTRQVIKGIQYAIFAAGPGTFVASYSAGPLPPVVTATSPASGAIGVSVLSPITATFSNTMNDATITTSTFTLSAGGTTVPGTVTYDAGSQTATVAPNASLSPSTTYTSTVSASVQDTLGNSLGQDFTWTFTTGAAPACPCSIFGSLGTPANDSANDGQPIETGVRFRSDVDGYTAGIQFYKGSLNTGAHVGQLWDNSGGLLATATFVGESASGWQQAFFSQPVHITANTTYIASYFSPTGYFNLTSNYFTQDIANPPMHGLAEGADGPNGAFIYTSTPAFPNADGGGSNYWVDVIFNTTATVGQPPVISVVSAQPVSGTSAIVTWTTDIAATSVVNYGTSSGSLNQTATAPGTTIGHQVALNGLSPNTTYYYQVTSTDLQGDSATAPATPASFTMPSGAVTDAALADFAAGTGTCSAVPLLNSGAVILTPAADAEFSGTALPTGWGSLQWNPSGEFFFGNGGVTLDGVAIASSSAYAPGTSLEFVATFSGQPFQNVGLVTDINFDQPWILFSTGASGSTLYARIAGAPDVPIAGNWLAAPHRFRIDWTANSVTFWIDGTPVSTQTAGIPTGSLVPVASDATFGGGSLSVNWMRLSPYAPSCSYTSRVLDSGTTSSWGTITWISDLPAATSLAMSYRTGNTAAPDASWTSFNPIGTSGTALSATSRYIQYGASLATGDVTRTPALENVTILYTIVITRPPVITTQPKSQSIIQGQSATLSVVATGTSLTYQWYTVGSGGVATPILGATSNSLMVSPTVTTSYGVFVKNQGGSVKSATATVTVGQLPVITTQPKSQSIVQGQSATLSVVATGTSLTYQWYTVGSGGAVAPIPGATSSSLTVSPTVTTRYGVLVKNKVGSLKSATATVSVIQPPVIITQPSSQTITLGQSATLSVVATGTSLTYQWYTVGSGGVATPITGATSSSLTVSPTATTRYGVLVKNPAGSLKSVTATVTVH